MSNRLSEPELEECGFDMDLMRDMIDHMLPALRSNFPDSPERTYYEEMLEDYRPARQ